MKFIGPATVEIDGLEVHLCTQEEAETAEIVVCRRTSDFDRRPPGALDDTCNDCGAAIYVSPLSPKTPPRICWECVGDRVKGGRA